MTLPEISNVSIEPSTGLPGGDVNCVPLKRYIDQNDRFSVLFNDYSLAYIDGALYRDDQFTDGGTTFLRYFKSCAGLTNSTSEKGVFAIGQRQFEAQSVFGELVRSVANGDDVLVCDDLGDEWADFIGVCNSSTPKSISFYHAKHGELSLGASPFHVAVSQATKNLGRMSLPDDLLASKSPSWSDNYRNGGVQTSIPRLHKGTLAQFIQAASDARLSPDTIKRVFIVTSSLSYTQLKQTFSAIQAGTAPTPHFVQLYWLLMTYFSACTEAGACPYVVCQA